MNDLNPISNSEHISALIDGELSADECAQQLDGLLADAQAIETWHAYQVVGDVLRSPGLAPTRGDLDFWERLEQRLLQEPQRPLAVSDEDLFLPMNAAQATPVDVGRPVANAPVFRWKVLAGVACLALAGVVGDGLWNQANLRSGGELAFVKPVVSVAPVVVAIETPVGPMLRDPRLDELMTAHRQLGGHSALQVPAGFLRNATYEGVGR